MYKVTLINDSKETVVHHPEFNDLKIQVGNVKKVVKMAASFNFEILPHNPGYNLINPMKTLITVQNMLTGRMEFDGRILIPTESMDDSGKFAKSFLCAGELSYLNDSSQRHGEYRNMTIRQFLQVMIDQHNKEIADDDIDKRLVLGTVNVTNSTDNVYRYLGYDSTLDSINDKLIDRMGGELWIRKENGVRYLDYLVQGGEVKQTEIRLSHNLKSIEKEADPSEIISRLIPLGVSIESEEEEAVDASPARLTIESVNNGLDYIEDAEAIAAFGVFAKSQTWDDITQPANLLTRGSQFLCENNRVKVKHVITALDLSLIDLDIDSFELGNSHPVRNPIMGIDETLRIVEKNIDIIDPANNSLVVGDLFKTASKYQSEANKSRQNVTNLQGAVNGQSRTLGVLRTEVEAVNTTVSDIKLTLDNSDLPGLEEAVMRLNLAIMDLSETLEPATYLKDGLMSKEDKAKIDTLQNYEPATETVDGLLSASDKAKLDRIDEVLLRLAALEGGRNG